MRDAGCLQAPLAEVDTAERASPAITGGSCPFDAHPSERCFDRSAGSPGTRRGPDRQPSTVVEASCLALVGRASQGCPLDFCDGLISHGQVWLNSGAIFAQPTTT